MAVFIGQNLSDTNISNSDHLTLFSDIQAKIERSQGYRQLHNHTKQLDNHMLIYRFMNS